MSLYSDDSQLQRTFLLLRDISSRLWISSADLNDLNISIMSYVERSRILAVCNPQLVCSTFEVQHLPLVDPSLIPLANSGRPRCYQDDRLENQWRDPATRGCADTSPWCRCIAGARVWYSCRQPKPATFIRAEWLTEMVQFLCNHLQLLKRSQLHIFWYF